MDPIYLDHNATAPMLPEVAEVMDRCHRAGYANPASAHSAGRRARQRLEEARERIAGILGADVTTSRADRVIFTSGGTEANNLALRGLALARAPHREPGRLIISAIEHPSIIGPAEYLQRQGWEVAKARVTRQGVVDLDHLRELIDEPTSLVSVMLGNNETGVLQPVKQLAGICELAGVPLHTDAVQVVGKLPVDFRRLGTAALTLSAHKLHGPRGIGALVLRHGVLLKPILFGGFQQEALRPGTESVALAAGLQMALEIWQREADSRATRMCKLRDRLEGLLLAGDEDLQIHGAGAPRLPHTTNVSFLGLDRQALLMALDLAGVACSSGSACASGSSEPSPVLVAMGCGEAAIQGSLRLSLGACTTAAEVDLAARRILLVVKDLRQHR